MTLSGYTWLDVLLSVVATLLASSGFWLYAVKKLETKTMLEMKKLENKTMVEKLLIGLAHDRITWLGHLYLGRGFLTHEEYENLNDYLFLPYEKLGGNGTAKKVMEDIRKLPLHADHSHPHPRLKNSSTDKGHLPNDIFE